MPTPDLAPRNPFSRPSFRRWYAAESLLALGTSMGLAVTLAAVAVTGSVAAAGVLTGCVTAFELGLGLLGGALSDTHSRRRLLRVSVLVSAAFDLVLLVLLAVLLLSDGPSPTWLIVAVCAALLVSSAGTGLADPVLDGSLKSLIGPAEFPRAMSAAHARTPTLSIVGSPVVGGLYGLAAPHPRERPARERHGVRGDHGGGPLAHGRRHDGARRRCGRGRFRGGQHRRQRTDARAHGSFRPGWLAIGGLGAMTVCFGLLFALPHEPWVLFVLAAACMVPSPALNGGLFGHVFAVTPPDLQGRIMAVFGVVGGAASVVAPMLSGAAVSHGLTAALAVAVCCVGALGVALLWGSPAVRAMPRR